MEPQSRGTDGAALPRVEAPRRVEVLVVDPEGASRRQAIHLLEEAGYAPVGVEGGAAALEMAGVLRPPAVLVDCEVADVPPDRLVRELRRLLPGCGVVLTARDEGLLPRDQAPDGVATLRKPLSAAGLAALLEGLVAPDSGGDPSSRPLSLLVGHSPQMQAVKAMVVRAAPSDASVLVTGESGTGKELVAQALHGLSPRASGPFVAVNCAALPDSLLESELFGHERGAFTGAGGRKEGRFELAHGGTLFLDEIGEIPPRTQVKLLRVLQERTFERVGGTTTLHVDVRVVAATNSDLRLRVRQGLYRDDLYYRLAVLSVQTPPLRERLGDVPELWAGFLRDFARQEGRAPPESDPETQAVLMAHDWPGNVRELRNAAQYATVMGRADRIRPEHLPPYLAARPSAQADPLAVRIPGMTLAELEQAAILRTYEALGRNARRTAAMLGISIRKVRYRLKAYREQGLL